MKSRRNTEIIYMNQQRKHLYILLIIIKLSPEKYNLWQKEIKTFSDENLFI